jgi:hypothetical protein
LFGGEYDWPPFVLYVAVLMSQGGSMPILQSCNTTNPIEAVTWLLLFGIFLCEQDRAVITSEQRPAGPVFLLDYVLRP